MKLFEFTPKQKLSIAEFHFAYETGTLIDGEVIRVIDTLNAHGIIENPYLWRKNVNNKVRGTIYSLFHIMKEKIDTEQMESILKDYYSGNL